MISGHSARTCLLHKTTQGLARHWLLLFNLVLGLLVAGTVAAPALMALGLEWPGRFLYALYGFTCHQLPQ